VNGNTGWAVGSSATTGNVIIKSTDAGFVWTGQTAPNTEQMFGVSFAAMDTGTAVGGNGTIIHTSNSGTTWVNQLSGTSQILNGVSFINTNVGFAVGNGGTILSTTNGGLSGINNISNEVPLNFSLKQNYPNPFNPSTVIRFQMPEAGQASLKVYDAMGREVQTLVNERLNAGIYETKFEGSGLTSGVYFYKLITNGFTETKKMLMIK
jgi:hypothetical protein